MPVCIAVSKYCFRKVLTKKAERSQMLYQDTWDLRIIQRMHLWSEHQNLFARLLWSGAIYFL